MLLIDLQLNQPVAYCDSLPDSVCGVLAKLLISHLVKILPYLCEPEG